MNKAFVLGLGVLGGMFAAGPILRMTGIAPAPGFGMDDILEAAIIVAAVLLVDKLL